RLLQLQARTRESGECPCPQEYQGRDGQEQKIGAAAHPPAATREHQSVGFLQISDDAKKLEAGSKGCKEAFYWILKRVQDDGVMPNFGISVRTLGKLAVFVFKFAS